MVDITKLENCEGDNMKQINLNHAISGQYKLTEEDVDSLVQLLTRGCRHITKWAVRSALTSIQEEKSYRIYDGVIKNPKTGSWKYAGSQSYLDEIRTIRSELQKH